MAKEEAKKEESNPGTTWLIVIAVVLAVGVIIAILWGTVAAIQNGNGNTGGTGTFLPPCYQEVNVSDLVQISNTGTCAPLGNNCCSNGVLTDLFYLGHLPSSNYDYVAAPYGTQPFDVCVGFCTNWNQSTKVCSGPNYNGLSAQTNFNNCLALLSSTTCAPPIPVAALGTTMYYPNTPTSKICT